MSKKPPFISGATGANMLALHAKRPAFLLAQTKGQKRAELKKADLLGTSVLDPQPQFNTFHDPLKPLSAEPQPGTVKHGLSEGEDSVADAKVRVSRTQTNFSVVATNEIAQKLGRVVPSVSMVDGRVWLELRSSSKGYAWTPYNVEGYSRFSVSEATMSQMGADKIEVFGMTDAETVEQGISGSYTVIMPTDLKRARVIHRQPETSPRRSGEDRQAPATVFRGGPMAGRTVEVAPDLGDEPITFGAIRNAIALLQRAQQSEEWKGMKLSVDEEGRIHAQVSWSL